MPENTLLDEHLQDVKQWAIALRPAGAGDLLRLLHGLRVKFGDDCKIAIVTTKSLVSVAAGVWCGRETVSRAVGGVLYAVERNLHWIGLPDLNPEPGADELLPSSVEDAWSKLFRGIPLCNGADVAWTSYSNYRRKAVKAWNGKRKLKLERIDRLEFCRRYFSTVFNGATADRRAPRPPIQALMVLRQADRATWRNSPPYHYYGALLDRSSKVTWTFAGLPNSADYPSIVRDRSLPFARTRLLNQIRRYSSEFDIAIGVNSSALDLCSAAGLPVIRDCEFQGHRPQNWSGGDNFNRFLGVSPNIGLGIPPGTMKTVRWWNEERFWQTVRFACRLLHDGRMPQRSGTPMHRVFGHDQAVPDAVDQWLRQPADPT
jgi:hypothetical protein